MLSNANIISGSLVSRTVRLILLVLALSVAACGPGADTSLEGASDVRYSASASCSAEAHGLDKAFQQVDSLLTEFGNGESIPGLAVGIVCADTLAWSQGYGIMAVDDPARVTTKTLFRIASVTKVFTATAIVQLAEEGVLSLDDTVRTYLHWFKLRRPAGTGSAPVTIRQLVTHTAGMPRDSRLTDFSRMYQPSRDDAIAALPDQRLQAPPGHRYGYSNLGYGILGEIIRKTSGIGYAQYLEEQIFEPLGMRTTLAHPTQEDHTAWGHGLRRPDGSRPRAEFWELGIATPAGGMASSICDLSKYVIDQLAPYVRNDSKVISSNGIRNMHRVHHMMDPTRGGSGLGWGVEISGGQHLIYHGGELPEQTSFVLIDLKSQIGIILLTNAEGIDVNGLTQKVLGIMRRTILGPEASFPRQAIPPGNS